MAADFLNPPLRLILSRLHRLRKGIWYFTRPVSFGAHALALTRAGNIVLVKLRYAPGWRLPGGGRKPDEDPRAAVLRELAEEIGMTSHGAVELVSELDEPTDFRRDSSALFIVRDVEYAPGWSIEVEAVMEAALDALPSDIAARTRQLIEAARPTL